MAAKFGSLRRRGALRLRLLAGPALTEPVIGMTALADDTIVAVDVTGFASGFGAEPQIDVAREATLHLDDTDPAPIVDDGTGSTLASPVRNLFQTYSPALRLVLRVAWIVRAPGLVQVVEGVSW